MSTAVQSIEPDEAEADLYAKTQAACSELIAVAALMRDAATKLDVARARRDYAGMRSAWLTLTDSPHRDLGFQASAMIAAIEKAIEKHGSMT